MPSVQDRKDEVPHRIKEICAEYFDFDIQWFHLEILEKMFAGGQMVVEIPSDHGKSTMACFLFPILSLMNNPDETHLICGVNLQDSRRRVQAIQRELTTNKALLLDYPWIGKPEDRENRVWTAKEFNVAGRTANKPNPSVIAVAIGSGDIRGRRGKLIMDDVEGEDARWSPQKRQQLYDFAKLEAVRCYENPRDSSRPLLIALGTPFDVDSFYFRLEEEEWEVIKYPVYMREYAVNSVGQQWWNPEYLWQAQAEKVEKMRRKLNKDQFSVMYMMDPTGGDATIMSYNELLSRTKRASFKADEYVTFVSLDPAAGTANKKNDYAGISVNQIYWAQGEEMPQVKLLEAYQFKPGLFEQVHLCAHLAAVYKCPVVYERNSQQGGTYFNAFQHLHPETKLIPRYTATGAKFDTKMGLTVIRTLIRDERFQIDETALETEGVRAFLTEVRDLGSPNTHDHICASVWFVVRHAYESVRFYNGPKLVNGYGQQQGRGGRGGYQTPYFGGRPAVRANVQLGWRGD